MFSSLFRRKKIQVNISSQEFEKQLNRLQKILPNKFTYTKLYGSSFLLMTPNQKATMVVEVRNGVLDLAKGETESNARGKGYGMFLRAVPIYAALLSNKVTNVVHSSEFYNYNQMKKYNVPPSHRIVKYLGMKTNSKNNTSIREKMKVKNVSPIVRNRIRRVVYGYPLNYKEYKKIVNSAN